VLRPSCILHIASTIPKLNFVAEVQGRRLECQRESLCVTQLAHIISVASGPMSLDGCRYWQSPTNVASADFTIDLGAVQVRVPHPRLVFFWGTSPPTPSQPYLAALT
jgi:hypothetical protein